MNGQILTGIIIMLLGTGIGTYLIQKGRTKLAFENSQNLIKSFKSLDSTSRAEIIRNSNLGKDEIILLVNNQTKSSAIEIVTAVEGKFGIINEDLIKKEKQIKELEQIEEKRKQHQNKQIKLQKTSPKFRIQALFIQNDNLILQIEPLNKVPFKFKFNLSNDEGNEIANRIVLEPYTLYPKEGKKYYSYKYDPINYIERSGKIPLSGFQRIKLRLNFESVYFSESKESSLAGTIEKVYLIDLDKKVVMGKE